MSKLNPTKFGSRKVFRCVSHVPSPTNIVFEEYVLLPAGASCGDGDMITIVEEVNAQNSDETTSECGWKESEMWGEIL